MIEKIIKLLRHIKGIIRETLRIRKPVEEEG